MMRHFKAADSVVSSALCYKVKNPPGRIRRRAEILMIEMSCSHGSYFRLADKLHLSIFLTSTIVLACLIYYVRRYCPDKEEKTPLHRMRNLSDSQIIHNKKGNETRQGECDVWHGSQ